MRSVMDEAIRDCGEPEPRDFTFRSTWISSIRSDAPGVGTPVRGGVTYREAHLAMEMICDSGRMVSMEVVEVNPVIDEANRTAILAVELILSAMGKKDSVTMKTRVAVVYGGRSGEHEVSLRLGRVGDRCDGPGALRSRALCDLEGRPLEPRSDSARARRESRDRCRVSPCCTEPSAKTAPCRACSSSPICLTSAPNVMASAVSMDKDVMKRLCRDRGLPVVEYTSWSRVE